MNLPDPLRKAIEQDRLAHAYLFYGRRHHEYADVVMAFFTRLVCERNGDGTDEACGTCPSCKQVNALSYADLVTINPPSTIDADIEREGRSRIGVDEVRDNIIAATSLTSSESGYKLFWLNDMTRFTEEASNCLLKVLEEPPGDTVFVLTARSLGDCLPTIRSRCQWIRFRPDSIDRGSVENTCRTLWPDEDWQEECDEEWDVDRSVFDTWKALLTGDQRSSDLSWNQSLARGFLTFILVLIHEKYAGELPGTMTDVAEPLEYKLLPDILERIDELDQGGNALFIVNSLLEEIHFPGETSPCRHAI